MASLIWAFSAMLVAVLIVYFLPIGLTKSGKIIVPLTGFLLALAGVAAESVFALWQTLLMLVALILFVTYIFDHRLGTNLFLQNDHYEKVQSDALEQGFMEMAAGHEHSKTKEPLPVQTDILKKKETVSKPPQRKQQTEADTSYTRNDAEDISFLLNRSITIEKEKSKKTEEPKHEVDYLSELEEILLDQKEKTLSDDKSEYSSNNHVATEHEIPVLTFNDQPSKKKEETPPKTKTVSPLEGLEEIPVLPFHEKEGDS